MIDFIVHRQSSDPSQYRDHLKLSPSVTLIEVERAPSVIAARLALTTIGCSPYITWFDPDDTLFCYTMTNFIHAITQDPTAIGFLATSHIRSGGRPMTPIALTNLHESPTSAHLMRVFKRSWLSDNIELFNNYIPEWPIIAKAIEDGAVILPFSGYCWNVGTGAHSTIGPREVVHTRGVVQQILGDKYKKLGQLP